MKKLAYLGFLLLAISVQSQENKIPEGTYVSTKKGETIKFNIKSDNTFEMSFLTGKINQKNDTITLETETLNSPTFEIQKIESNSSEKLQLSFTKESYLGFYGDYIFIGTQKKEKGPIEYKSISEYLPGLDEYEEREYNIAIDKPKYLYLVYQDQVEKEGTIYKFDIAKETNALEIKYNTVAKTNLKLFATYNSAKQELSISDGKSPLVFVLDSSVKKKDIDNGPKPMTVEKVKNWDYPGKKKEVVENDYAATAYSANDKPTYVFKVKTENTLAKSLKKLEKEKEKEKYLVVFVDYSKEATKNFKEFITRYEENASNYMYDTYNAEYDKFNFYLANPQDKNIPKNIDAKEPHFLIYNQKGSLLYFEKGIDYNNSGLISSGYSIPSELSNANCEALLDFACTSKSSIQEKKDILEFVTKTYVSKYTTNAIEETQPADVAPSDVTPIDKESSTDQSSTEVYATAVDESLGFLKETQNFYKLKSTNEIVNKLWKTIFNSYKKQPLDMGIAVLGLQELQNKGFSQSFFDETKSTFESLDYEVLDYLIQNSKAITEKELPTDYTVENIYDIKNELLQLLNSKTIESNTPEATDKLFYYYKKLIDNFPKEYYTLQSYLAVLKEKDRPQDYFTSFEIFFSSIITNNENVIEQLDKAYTADNTNPDKEWTSYKNNFSGLCNESSWWIVENKNLHEKSWLVKAIYWSEISLQIEKNNGYYLDTLAQLYYINGEKQKGITTQENALKNFIKENDPEVFEKMKMTLKQMIKGNY